MADRRRAFEAYKHHAASAAAVRDKMADEKHRLFCELKRKNSKGFEMNEYAGHKIWSVGHSNLEWGRFVEMLHRAGIRQLADVRSYPGSRANPQFGQQRMREGLRDEGIEYEHFVDLGGRRPEGTKEGNCCVGWWEHPAFRGYASWAMGPDFQAQFWTLQTWAGQAPTAFCCSEANWWRCHRRILTDYLLADGWEVEHLAQAGTSKALMTESAVARKGPEGEVEVLYPTDRLFY